MYTLLEMFVNLQYPDDKKICSKFTNHITFAVISQYLQIYNSNLLWIYEIDERRACALEICIYILPQNVIIIS